ncbi:MAG: acyltransferase family protein [Bacteroidota bacterium]
MASGRLHYIDWLRVLAFATLIIFHCAVPFVEHYHWEINSKETSPWITRIIWWMHQWRLPLLFFIAGVGVRFSLRKRSVLNFFGERVIRLFIPLAFAIFFITPIQVYFEWLQEGKISMDYWEFYPSVYKIIPYPEGSFTWSHMWFVAYLFVFTIVLIPIFSLAKIKWFNRLKTFFNTIFSHPLPCLFLSLPFVLYIFTLFVDWPEQGSLIDDWYVFISSITFYLLGFLLSGMDAFWQTCLKHRKVFFIVAILLAGILIGKYYWDWKLYRPKSQNFWLYQYGILNGFHIWMIILSSVGYTMKYLDYSNPKLIYLNTAIYPFYILHQAVIVASGYYVLQWNIGIPLKFLILVFICVTSIWLVYHFVVKNTMVTRVLFGMKWNRK